MNVVRIISFVVGAIAISLTIVSIFLLIFIRDTSQTSISTAPIIPQIKPNSVLDPLSPVVLTTPKLYDSLSPDKLLALVSPVTSTGNSISVSEIINNVPTNTSISITQPSTYPGELTFDQTISNPLQVPPQGMGWVSMLPNADGFFTSFENGFSMFGQYIYTTDQKDGTQSTYQIFNTAYKTKNNVIFNCSSDTSSTSNSSILSINNNASSIGSVGYASMNVSNDGTRLYVAFQQPYMSNVSDAQIFPFSQYIGTIAVYTRPSSINGIAKGYNWTYNCNLTITNPFGGQVGGFYNLLDPESKKQLNGDDFGQYIQTSVNLVNNRKAVAVRMNYTINKSDGSAIAIYEESDENKHILTGLIELWVKDNKDITFQEKLVFGKSFGFGDDVILASCINRIAYFKRNKTNSLWEFKNFITIPDSSSNEKFGTTIRVSQSGLFALVGSPTNPSDTSPGIGGSVYLYTRSDKDSDDWILSQTIKDPNKTPTKAFGYFINVDRRFLVVAISANQDNRFMTPTPTSSTNALDFPYVVLMSINQISKSVDTTVCPQIPQPTNNVVSSSNNPNYYIDPCFGANMSLEFLDLNYQTLMLIVNSPINQYLLWYTISF